MTSRFGDSAEFRPDEASEGASWNCSTVPCYIERQSNLPDFVPSYPYSSIVPLQPFAVNGPALVYVSRHPCLEK